MFYCVKKFKGQTKDLKILVQCKKKSSFRATDLQTAFSSFPFNFKPQFLQDHSRYRRFVFSIPIVKNLNETN